MSLSTTIKTIQDIMRKDDGVDGDAQRISQLTWMLFLKVFDQREEEWEAADPAYQSPLPRKYRWRNWAAYKVDAQGKKKPQIPAADLIPFVNNELFRRLRDHIDPDASPVHQVIKNVFDDATNYMKSGSLMQAVIEKLEESINFHDFKERTHLGDVYEQVLSDLRGAGNAGEFYTPRAITQFMISRLNPSLKKRETVLDPACGTGGFLTAAIDHYLHQLGRKPTASERRNIDKLVRGMEKKQLPHLLCVTNMVLHDVALAGQIKLLNTLSIPWDAWGDQHRVNCVITNPPFGGFEEDTIGATFPAALRTRETADMFMALIIKKLLHKHGRAAIVLPDGFLFGEGIKNTLKETLLRECKLHTIVRLPRGVFAPYTNIKTNLLFFTRMADTKEEGSKHFHTDTIWYYEHPYPQGYKSYSKTKPIRYEEFAPEQDWWGTEESDFAERTENEFAWKVDFKSKRERAEAAATPHWQHAEQLNKQAAGLEATARELRESIKGIGDAQKRRVTEDDIDILRIQSEGLRLQARNAQVAGDRLYWPIFNLDSSNPRAPAQESHDPDVLLERYKEVLGEIEETENRLKSEIALALTHHFSHESP